MFVSLVKEDAESGVTIGATFQEVRLCRARSPDRTLSINYPEKCLANLLSHLMICEFSTDSPSIMQHRIKSPGGSRTH